MKFVPRDEDQKSDKDCFACTARLNTNVLHTRMYRDTSFTYTNYIKSFHHTFKPRFGQGTNLFVQHVVSVSSVFDCFG